MSDDGWGADMTWHAYHALPHPHADAESNPDANTCVLLTMEDEPEDPCNDPEIQCMGERGHWGPSGDDVDWLHDCPQHAKEAGAE